jgi:hypothetical protein
MDLKWEEEVPSANGTFKIIPRKRDSMNTFLMNKNHLYVEKQTHKRIPKLSAHPLM